MRKRPRRLLAGAALCGAVVAAVLLSRPPRQSPQEAYDQAVDAVRNGSSIQITPAIRLLLEQPQEFNDHATLLLALVSLRQGDFDQTLTQLATIPPTSPVRPDALRFAGEALYHQKLVVPAETTFKLLRSEYPEYTDAYRWLGAIYYDLGAYEIAINNLETVMAQDPTDFQAPRAIAGMLKDFERYSETLEYYEMALARGIEGRTRHQVIAEFAESLISLHKYDAALELLERHSIPPGTQPLAAECYLNLGDQDKAWSFLEAASTLPARSLLRAQILGTQGELEDALAELADLLEKNPHHVEARYQAANLLKRLGRHNDAEEYMTKWQESLELTTQLNTLNRRATRQPFDAELRIELSNVCKALGKHELADMWKQAAAACRQRSLSDTPSTTAP